MTKILLHLILSTFFLEITFCSCNDSNAATDASKNNFSFQCQSNDITLNRLDSQYLIKRYQSLQQDAIDTLEWPLPEERHTMLITVDISGTMFEKKYSVFTGDTTQCFFDYSLNELMSFLKQHDKLKDATKIKIQLAGAGASSATYSIGACKEITIPPRKILLREYFYSQDNNRIEVFASNLSATGKPNLYDSLKKCIQSLCKKFTGAMPAKMVAQESPLLEKMMYDLTDLSAQEGKKDAYYLTDGYFSIGNGTDMEPGNKAPLQMLQKKFSPLQKKILPDSSIHITLFGMNSMGDVGFRNRMNSFYRWYLKDSANLTIKNIP